MTEIKEYVTDLTAAGIIASTVFMAIMMIPFPEYLNVLTGAAVSYLFIKNSPNTV